MNFLETSYILLILGLVACGHQENHNQSALISDCIAEIIQVNEGIMEDGEVNLKDSGFRRADVAEFKRAQNLLSLRKNAKTLELYQDSLLSQYRLTETYNATQIAQIEALGSRLSSKLDSSIYLLSLLRVESVVLKYYANRMGPFAWFKRTASSIKTEDTISLGNTFSMAVYFDRLIRNRKVKVDSTLEITCNKKPVQIPVSFDQAGNVIFVKFKPLGRGNYEIVGSYWLQQPYHDEPSQISYRESFVVR